jgi:acetylglutamate kinase
LAGVSLVLASATTFAQQQKDDPSSLVSRITTDEAKAAMKSGSVSGGMLPKLKALVDAVEGGVGRGHILSGTEPGALLLELFTSRGSGTLIAEPHDVSEIVDNGPRS